MARKGKTKNICKILFEKTAGRGLLKDTRLDLNGDMAGGL